VSLASSTSAGLSSASGVAGYTNGLNYMTTTITLGIGTPTLGFGVYNTQNRATLPALMVHNLVVTTSAIPEPAMTAALCGAAVLAVVGFRRRC
jgi:hypothetical protein